MRKSKLAKAKDNPRSTYWKHVCDRLWSELIRRTGCCAVGAACSGKLEAHHLINRNVLSARHDPMNGICLCTYHHQFSARLSPHNAPITFTAWLMAERPEQYRWVVDHKWQLPLHPDFRETADRLRKKLEEIS